MVPPILNTQKLKQYKHCLSTTCTRFLLLNNDKVMQLYVKVRYGVPMFQNLFESTLLQTWNPCLKDGFLAPRTKILIGPWSMFKKHAL